MNNNDEQKPIPDHEYDGIQEFDYPAPFWWQLFFYLSIAFAFGYYIYYEVGGGMSSDERINQSIAEVKRMQIQNQPTGPDVKALLAMVNDPEQLKPGKEQFASKCASCHAPDGGGLVGPNLADKFWIHGKGELADIYKVVREGVLDKGMPAWGALMSDAELNSVVAYVKTLEGTKSANPKAPQGTEIK
jgi:cytochrome c oxidase cbb3-type subunit 3